jgi:hypothetical protein
MWYRIRTAVAVADEPLAVGFAALVALAEVLQQIPPLVVEFDL